MKDKFSIYTLFVLSFLLLANLFTHITNSLTLSFLIIILQLLCLRKEDSVIVFMLMGSVLGSFYAQEGVRYIGSILTWGAALFMFKDLSNYKSKLLLNFLPLIFFLFIVVVSIISTQGGNYSFSKFTFMLMNAIVYIIAFTHLCLYNYKHNFYKIGFMFIIYSLFLIGYMNELINTKISIETLIYSFAGFRNEINDYISGNKDVWHVNYQDIGIHACLGLVLSLFTNNSTEKKYKSYIIVLAFFVVWYSAARQAILSFVIILLSYLGLYKGLKLKNIILIFIFMLIGYALLSNIDNQSFEFLFGSTEGKGSARDNIINVAMIQFHENPIFGVGFGRFYYQGEYGCNEHNLFVELLTEMGVFGFLFFIYLLLNPLINSYSYIKNNIKDISVFLLILLLYFLRSMVSSDLRETIIVLIIILCINMIRKFNTNLI